MTAKEKLTEIVQKRKWYGDKLTKGKASMYKTLIRRDEMTNSLARKILFTLEIEPVQEEVW